MLTHPAQRLCVFGLLVLAVLSGCASATEASGAGGATPKPCDGAACAVGPGIQQAQVFIEPSAGAKPIVDAIEAANSSVWVEVYLLTDSRVIHALEDAVNRRVDVRVLLEMHPYGGGDISAQQVLDELQAAGVQAKAADPAYHYTHEKTLVIDGATAYVLTSNLTRSGLGGSTTTANREYGVIDTNAQDVCEVAAIFTADWQRTTPSLSDANLVVSPVNARAKLAGLIGAAHRSLLVEDEEMYDTSSEDALIAAAGRGVDVRVVLPAPAGSSPSVSPDVARLLRGGVHVRYLVAPYMHAKLIVADGSKVFVGSENFSAISLDENRELGILLADPQVLATLQATFQRDWSAASDA